MSAVTSLAELSDDGLFCRTEGHEWHWQTDLTLVDTKGRLIEVERRTSCSRCGATARKVIDAVTWTVKSRKIDHYPDAYLIKGKGRIDRRDIYREQFSPKRFAA